MQVSTLSIGTIFSCSSVHLLFPGRIVTAAFSSFCSLAFKVSFPIPFYVFCNPVFVFCVCLITCLSFLCLFVWGKKGLAAIRLKDTATDEDTVESPEAQTGTTFLRCELD